MIFVYTMGVFCMPDSVVWRESTLDIVVWVKSKMAVICPRSNNTLISFSAYQKHIFATV